MVLLTSNDGFDKNQKDGQAPKPNQLQLMERTVSVTESHQEDASNDGFDQNQEDGQAPKPKQLQFMEGLFG